MESERDIKRRDKIFNVRKLAYKQFNNQKYLKENYSPLHHQGKKGEEGKQQLMTTSNLCNGRNMQYHYQLTLTTSPAYKELHAKYRALKDGQLREKGERLKALREKEHQLEKYVRERTRIENEQQMLIEKRDQLRFYIEKLRERRELIEAHFQSSNQQFELVGINEVRDAMMGMHYQGGLDINPDEMTYEELLQLEEKMGKVSKGLTEEQYAQLDKLKATKADEEELCSICYEQVKEGEQIHNLPCKHTFHCECIKEWLSKEKVCPMCKQELPLPSPPSSPPASTEPASQ